MVGVAMDSAYRTTASPAEAAVEVPLAHDATEQGRLSWRTSALFILGVSLICWGAIIMAVRALIG